MVVSYHCHHLVTNCPHHFLNTSSGPEIVVTSLYTFFYSTLPRVPVRRIVVIPVGWAPKKPGLTLPGSGGAQSLVSKRVRTPPAQNPRVPYHRLGTGQEKRGHLASISHVTEHCEVNTCRTPRPSTGFSSVSARAPPLLVAMTVSEVDATAGKGVLPFPVPKGNWDYESMLTEYQGTQHLRV